MMRTFLALASALSMLAAMPAARAQQVTIPPLVRIVVPFGPGTSPDILARAVAPQLATRLGTNVIVDNRAGGSTLIGAAAVANGPADGSLLLITSSSTYSAAATLKSMPFDMNRDLLPIAMLSDGPMFVAASAKSGIKTPADIVAQARARPDTVTYGSSGIGSIVHLAAEQFADTAKVQLKHIPYKGNAFALVDLNAGIIDLMIGSYGTFAPSIKSGRAVLVAMTSAQPSATFPGLPTMGSVAPGYVGSNWVAAFAPASVPAPLAQRLHREVTEIMKSKELVSVLQSNDASPGTLSLEALRPHMRDELAGWKKLAADKKIVAE